MAAEEEPQGFSDVQRVELETRQADQDRTFAAIHALEAALASAAPGRERAWRDAVLATLEVLDDATADEQANASRPDSLLSDIQRTQPLLRNRARGVRLQYRQLCEQITSLRRELREYEGDEVDYADLRHRLAWLLTALRHQRARESDLIYEAYYEAFQRDIEEDARRSTSD